MRRATAVLRRSILVLLLSLVIAWVTGESAQWLFRYRTEKLFATFRALQIQQSSSSDAKALIKTWEQYGQIRSGCNEDTCRYSLVISNLLPEILQGKPDGGIQNLLPVVVGFVGLRSESAEIGFTAAKGKVAQKEFALDVGLPVFEWFRREGSYVPDLAAEVSETDSFNSVEQNYVTQSHPFRVAHHQKGTYAVLATFTPEEEPAEQRALTDFRFTCLTQIFPCHSEREVLPEGWKLLQEHDPDHW